MIISFQVSSVKIGNCNNDKMVENPKKKRGDWDWTVQNARDYSQAFKIEIYETPVDGNYLIIIIILDLIK